MDDQSSGAKPDAEGQQIEAPGKGSWAVSALLVLVVGWVVAGVAGVIGFMGWAAVCSGAAPTCGADAQSWAKAGWAVQLVSLGGAAWIAIARRKAKYLLLALLGCVIALVVAGAGVGRATRFIGFGSRYENATFEEVHGVVAGGPGLVAVGWDDTLPDSGAAVWTSIDGIIWTRIPPDESVFGGELFAAMHGVVAGGPGLVAVGWDFYGPAVWVSSDGSAWTRVEVDDAGHMNAVVAGGPGVVAVGSRNGDAVVWISPDGIIWTRVPGDQAGSGDEFNDQMNGVAVTASGLVAVGVDVTGIGERAVAVWTSPDGVTWDRTPDDQAGFEGGSWMSAVVVGGPGVVAVGWDGSGNAAVWTSPDGVTWTRTRHDQSVLGGGVSTAMMTAVTTGGPGLVAVGRDGSGNAAVWTSVDGVTWVRVAHDESVFGGPEEQVMSGVVAGGSGLVAVGTDNLSAVVWTSSDGVTWTKVPLARPTTPPN